MEQYFIVIIFNDGEFIKHVDFQIIPFAYGNDDISFLVRLTFQFVFVFILKKATLALIPKLDPNTTKRFSS